MTVKQDGKRTLHISSDGTWMGTRVTFADTGEVVHGVRSIDWEVGDGEEAHAELRFFDDTQKEAFQRRWQVSA